jgi:hypothetical protein
MDVVLIRTIGRRGLPRASIRDLENLAPARRRPRDERNTPCAGRQEISREIRLDTLSYILSKWLTLKRDALKDFEHHRAGRRTDRWRDELGARGWVDIIPIASRRPRVAGEDIRKIFQRDRFSAVGSVSSDHHHRARQTEFDDPHLAGRNRRDLTVTHHEYSRPGTTIHESLTARKGATEIGGSLACGGIETAGNGAGEQIRADDISGA